MRLYPLAARLAELLARAVALLGGIVLLGVMGLTTVSVIGRAINWAGPVPGDFELVEIGVGFAVFCALPWCHLNRGHARVDLFQPMLGGRLNRLIDVLADLVMLGAAVLIAWRLWEGMLDKRAYGETTFILQLPLWQAYAACVLGAAAFVLVAAFAIWRSIRALRGDAT